MVGGVDGDADAQAAGELLAACAYAEAAARDNAAVSREIWSFFMGLLFFRCLNFLTERDARQGANQLCIVRGLG